jgi:hypothetical protein
MNSVKLPESSNESFGVTARGIWRFWVNLPLQVFFEREASSGDNSS